MSSIRGSLTHHLLRAGIPVTATPFTGTVATNYWRWLPAAPACTHKHPAPGRSIAQRPRPARRQAHHPRSSGPNYWMRWVRSGRTSSILPQHRAIPEARTLTGRPLTVPSSSQYMLTPTNPVSGELVSRPMFSTCMGQRSTARSLQRQVYWRQILRAGATGSHHSCSTSDPKLAHWMQLRGQHWDLCRQMCRQVCLLIACCTLDISMRAVQK
jgi:hypothetical protein